MTKQDPDKLCEACKKFDKVFENGASRIDVLVVCDHDRMPIEKHNQPKLECNESK